MDYIFTDEKIQRMVTFAPAFMPIPTMEAIRGLATATDHALRECDCAKQTADKQVLALGRQRACYLLGVQRGMEKYRNELLRLQDGALMAEMPFKLDPDEHSTFVYAMEDMFHRDFNALCACAGVAAVTATE